MYFQYFENIIMLTKFIIVYNIIIIVYNIMYANT